MKPIRIVTTKCNRCGKQLATANQSLTGLDSLKAALGDICKDCITQEEHQMILQAQGAKLSEPKKIGKSV